MKENDILAKKLLYRSSHRGCKETDFVLEDFAQHHLQNMTLSQQQEFAKILEQSDSDIYDWVTGKTTPPAQLSSEVMQELIRFSQRNAR